MKNIDDDLPLKKIQFGFYVQFYYNKKYLHHRGKHTCMQQKLINHDSRAITLNLADM